MVELVPNHHNPIEIGDKMTVYARVYIEKAKKTIKLMFNYGGEVDLLVSMSLKNPRPNRDENGESRNVSLSSTAQVFGPALPR